MKTLNIVTVIVMFIFTVAADLPAQDTGSKLQVLRIKQLMTASEFKACGLEKLSPEEIDRLDSWIQSYTTHVAEVLTEATSPHTPDVIESRIEGDFEGWEGETVFKLDNGQIWQQSSYAYTYHYAYRPEVLIYKTGGGYKMKMEGVDETIYVRRLK